MDTLLPDQRTPPPSFAFALVVGFVTGFLFFLLALLLRPCHVQAELGVAAERSVSSCALFGATAGMSSLGIVWVPGLYRRLLDRIQQDRERRMRW